MRRWVPSSMACSETVFAGRQREGGTEPKETVSEQAIEQEKTPASGGMDTRVGDNVEEILIFRMISLR